MMTDGGSTAWFIDYDVRPSKQIERKILFDTVRAGELAGIDVAALPYIGLGGFRFPDFMAARRILGTSRYVSLERDKRLIRRCEYNKPFDSIEVLHKSAQDYLSEDRLTEPAVIWFDFEYPVNRNCREDIFELAAKCKPGSFVFVTALGEINRQVSGRDERRKKEYYVDRLGSFAQSFLEDEFANTKFPSVAVRMMQAFFVYGFKGRTSEGIYLPYFNMLYKDSVWMATAGGYFGPSENAGWLLDALRIKYEFLSPERDDAYYEVPSFNITEAERRLLDRAALPSQKNQAAANQLKRIGFLDPDVDRYRVIMTHVPRYFEALI